MWDCWLIERAGTPIASTGGASGHTYAFTRNPDGTTDVDVVTVREGKNLKGRAFEVLVRLGGKRLLGKALDGTVKAVEERAAAPA